MPAEEAAARARPPPQPAPAAARRIRPVALLLPLVASALLGRASGAPICGAISGPRACWRSTLQQMALFAAAMLLPPLLFVAIAAAFGRASQHGPHRRSAAGRRRTSFHRRRNRRAHAPRGWAARCAANSMPSMPGWMAPSRRLRALETVLENQIAALDEAGARAEVRGEAIAARLTQESERLEALSRSAHRCRRRAPRETVAGRAAQLRASIETAEGALKMAAQSLDVQAAGFRAAAAGRRRCAARRRGRARQPGQENRSRCPTPRWRAPNSCWRGRKSIAPR